MVLCCHPEKLVAPVSEHLSDRSGVVGALRRTGEGDDTSIDRIRMNIGDLEGLIKHAADGLRVDVLFPEIRRQRHRRLVHTLVAHHEEPTGQFLGEPPEAHARKDHLSAGGSDIDPDG